ncbi:MAG: DMT family transporter [Burkholderiaceae bacterium]|jgi:drug/metabolite transporter (DMT)-like permease|uniref:DMT family transporter n=1 Tax=Polynucleobacter sp. MWH-Loch1C5 TaxID=2689108 RepID=UPI001C0D046D|nr:DMT family transporter [Polynucleobacter sp. MWH-Loch1C5]MBU3541731.1 DMT family transporter [Polynucleobacter sp. MWH-Loch1C5]NBV00047.1 DMT family transporter [Burkholderiaceae bacterium]
MKHWNQRWAAWIAPSFVIIWSTGFIIAKYGMPYAEPMTFLFMRFIGVLLLMLPLVWLLKAPWPSSSNTFHIAIAGLLLQAGYLGGVWAAVRFGMSAGLTALIVGLQPILTALFASWLRERVYPIQWLGLALGIAGVGLVVWQKLTLTGLDSWSLIFIVIALFSITAGTLYQKKFCPQFDLRTGSVIQFASSALLCLPFMFLFETREIVWHPELIGSLVWAILGLSIGAISLLFIMIRKGEATRVTSLMYLTPPTTAVMAWFLFDEPFTLFIAFGIVLTMLAVLLVNRAQKS